MIKPACLSTIVLTVLDENGASFRVPFNVAVVPLECPIPPGGSEYWFTIPGNHSPDFDDEVQPRLTILGSAGTSGHVEIQGLGFSTSFSIGPPGAVTVACFSFIRSNSY